VDAVVLTTVVTVEGWRVSEGEELDRVTVTVAGEKAEGPGGPAWFGGAAIVGE